MERHVDKSWKKQERKASNSHINQELVSTLNPFSRDRANFRSELCDLSSKDISYVDLLASYTCNQSGSSKQHKRGKSSQGSVQRKGDITTTSINEGLINISKQLKIAVQTNTRKPRILH
jgi:hypothetical protein